MLKTIINVRSRFVYAVYYRVEGLSASIHGQGQSNMTGRCRCVEFQLVSIAGNDSLASSFPPKRILGVSLSSASATRASSKRNYLETNNNNNEFVKVKETFSCLHCTCTRLTSSPCFKPKRMRKIMH